MSPSDQFRVVGRPFSAAEIAAVARLHAAEVPEGFLSSLGEPVLRTLYRHVGSSELGVLFVAESLPAGEPLGYICGALDTSALLREFAVRRWPIAVPQLAPRLLHPRRLYRMLETLTYPGAADPALPRAEIMNFVVVPSLRGRGVADRLFDHLIRWFGDHGEPAVKVVTGERQRRAHGFYEKSGAEPRGRTAVHRGAQSRIYVCPIPPPRRAGVATLRTEGES
ncbi:MULTISPECIES: GNAT family N-acetyltransferase [Actinoplanes]|uniref:GNAT family N-acetyltransferase n=1 Tax=Actinoplanes TaxID=1865 RepID=UPI0005F29BAC|nr:MULTISPECIES: GNAT family N-acetyltransferase [Actinoplanes]GLY08583.1 hypothetical protein Acsp01_89620 [Actinoplanes sp. NBRC 101535]